MEISSIKIWFALQLVIDFLFLIGIFWYLFRVRRELEEKVLISSSDKINQHITPFLDDAKRTTDIFEHQLREKRKIIKSLNETLDKKIASLNFLINRAASIEKNAQFTRKENNVIKASSTESSRDEKIIELYKGGLSNEEIAKRLGLSIGEVSIIINLRKKFETLSSDGR